MPFEQERYEFHLLDFSFAMFFFLFLKFLDQRVTLLPLVHQRSNSLSKPLKRFDHDVTIVLQNVQKLRVAIIIIDSEEMAVVQFPSSNDSV